MIIAVPSYEFIVAVNELSSIQARWIFDLEFKSHIRENQNLSMCLWIFGYNPVPEIYFGFESWSTYIQLKCLSFSSFSIIKFQKYWFSMSFNVKFFINVLWEMSALIILWKIYIYLNMRYSGKCFSIEGVLKSTSWLSTGSDYWNPNPNQDSNP